MKKTLRLVSLLAAVLLVLSVVPTAFAGSCNPATHRSKYNYVWLNEAQHNVYCPICIAPCEQWPLGFIQNPENHQLDPTGTYCTLCQKGKGSTQKAAHWYGEWSPVDDGTHKAVCKWHGEEKVVDCEIFEYTLGDAAFKICPVCGDVDDGTVIPAVSASASGKGVPSGELILRKGDILENTETVMSIGFELGGKLTQPKGKIKITLPTSEVSGYNLSVLSADGTETALETTEKGENTTFTVNFDGVKAVVLHLSAE